MARRFIDLLESLSESVRGGSHDFTVTFPTKMAARKFDRDYLSKMQVAGVPLSWAQGPRNGSTVSFEVDSDAGRGDLAAVASHVSALGGVIEQGAGKKNESLGEASTWQVPSSGQIVGQLQKNYGTALGIVDSSASTQMGGEIAKRARRMDKLIRDLEDLSPKQLDQLLNDAGYTFRQAQKLLQSTARLHVWINQQWESRQQSESVSLSERLNDAQIKNLADSYGAEDVEETDYGYSVMFTDRREARNFAKSMSRYGLDTGFDDDERGRHYVKVYI